MANSELQGCSKCCVADMRDFNLEALYKLAVTFFKEKQGTKALVLPYKEKLKFVALTKQVRIGPFKQHVETGFLDFVGNDRKSAWKMLGDMSNETAMSEFVKSLIDMCPSFVPFVKAHLAKFSRDGDCPVGENTTQGINCLPEVHCIEAGFLPKANTDLELCEFVGSVDECTVFSCGQFSKEANGKVSRTSTNSVQEDLKCAGKLDESRSTGRFDGDVFKESSPQEDHKLLYVRQELKETFLTQIRPMLQKLVEMQYPGDEVKQREGLKVMTEKQLDQLLQQCHVPMCHLADSKSQILEDLSYNWSRTDGSACLQSECGVPDEARRNDDRPQRIADLNDLPMLELPSLWTKTCINEFKSSLVNDAESTIEVGSGEIVTVRVPTNDGGSCLYWEFATDFYDIGFGVFFEWIVENADADDEAADDADDVENEANDDYIELGESLYNQAGANNPDKTEPPTEEVVQMCRLDSHEAVQCGSHVYSGPGIYLLKFDNSYSLWRSKRVYYRVYYTA